MKRFATFRFVARPLLAARGDVPATLEEGDTVDLRLWLLGVVPGNRHTIHLARVDDAHRTLATNERGGLLRTWNHTIGVEPLTAGTCRYTDTIEIDAGPFTPVACRVADAFFAHRQRRWLELVGAR